MLSFFRRKKPDSTASDTAASDRKLSIEELAAAFPAPSRAPDPAEVVATTDIVSEVSAAVPPPLPALPPELPPELPPVLTSPADTAIVMPIPTAAEIIVSEPAVIATVAVETIPPPLVIEPQPVPVEVIDTVTDLSPAGTGENLAGAMPAPAAAGKAGWRERLRNNVFTRSVGSLFSRNPRLDEDLLDEIETALLTADVGVTATTALIDSLRKRMKARDFADARALLTALRADLVAMLRPVAQPLQIVRNGKPFVLLTVGVNGVGKTTTIGKLAKRYKDEGRALMLAAGDTFRAAAVAQLQAWGDRNGVTVIAQGQNADAASVAFDALQAAIARGTEVLIADTAGRLHTQQGLMAELGKIKRVLQKLDADAPHEVLMVIDGTTGQNALSQLRQFNAAVGVTGLVVTKLDGTAKGGVVFALAREFGIPIRYAGIGERPEDLRVFDAEAFVDALLPESLGG